MDLDQYGEVINGKKTTEAIVDLIDDHGSLVIGWTDEEGTHYDILFTLGTNIKGAVQGGLKSTYLFVSIMRVGAFGFKCGCESSPEYYSEKLGVSGEETLIKLSQLLNSVRMVLTP